MMKSVLTFALLLSSAAAYSNINNQACSVLSAAFSAHGQTTRSATCQVTVTDGNEADVFKEALIDFAISGQGFAYSEALQVGSVAVTTWKTPIQILSGTIRCVLNPNYGWQCLYQNQDKNASCHVITSLAPVDKINLAGFSPAQDCVGQQTVWAHQRIKRLSGNPTVVGKFDHAHILVPDVVPLGLQDAILNGMTSLANDAIYPFTK